jgi:hypothetical protein
VQHDDAVNQSCNRPAWSSKATSTTGLIQQHNQATKPWRHHNQTSPTSVRWHPRMAFQHPIKVQYPARSVAAQPQEAHSQLTAIWIKQIPAWLCTAAVSSLDTTTSNSGVPSLQHTAHGKQWASHCGDAIRVHEKQQHSACNLSYTGKYRQHGTLASHAPQPLFINNALA